jgi:hypothetical protein
VIVMKETRRFEIGYIPIGIYAVNSTDLFTVHIMRMYVHTSSMDHIDII